MSAPNTAVEPPRDLLRELALRLYIEVTGRIYADTSADRARPQPKAVAQMCFKLAEAFQITDLEVNPTAIAAAAATAKRSVDIRSLHLDLEGIGKPR